MLGLTIAIPGVWLARAVGERAREPRSAPAWWLADRDGGAIALLDDSLFVVERWSLPWPTHVRARRGGGAWVVCALEGHPRGAYELREVDAGGELVSALALPPVVDLETGRAGEPLLLVREPGSGVRCLSVVAGGIEAEIAAPPRARALVPSAGRLGLVAGREGFHVLDPSGRFWVDAAATCGRTVLDARAGDEGWWLLVEGDPVDSTALLRLDPGLRPLSERACRAAASLPRSTISARELWVLGQGGAWAQRMSARGARRARLSALGGQAAVVSADGGLLVAAPGALLQLTPTGRPAPGQGGFAHLVDLAPVEGRSP